ncbi:hypothetical protein [Desulfovibrio sp. JC010]|nr:hypothetical protein [Desulfovibrio sp. JC010]
MNSLFTFALGAVSALVLVPMIFGGKNRHRHTHRKGGPVAKKGGGKRGK